MNDKFRRRRPNVKTTTIPTNGLIPISQTLFWPRTCILGCQNVTIRTQSRNSVWTSSPLTVKEKLSVVNGLEKAGLVTSGAKLAQKRQVEELVTRL